MANVLDLFDDEEPPPPPPPAPPLFLHPPPRLERAVGRPAPTYQEHLCEICDDWGCFGLLGPSAAECAWRCRAHVWPGFLPNDRLAPNPGSAKAAPPEMAAAGGLATPRPLGR